MTVKQSADNSSQQELENNKKMRRGAGRLHEVDREERENGIGGTGFW